MRTPGREKGLHGVNGRRYGEGAYEFPALSFSAETYTWFMKDEGRAHGGRIGHMIQVTARAGFAGFSPSHSWMGDYFEAAAWSGR